MPKIKPQLGTIQQTLMIPLWARAVELKKRNPIIRDETSQEILESLDYDFSLFNRAKASQIGCCIRSAEFDRYVAEFIEQNPEGTIVDIGAGLSNRRQRLDNGSIHWIDVDLPDAMQLRRQFFSPSDRHQMISHSIIEKNDWVESVKKLGQPPYFFVFEGVMMYLYPSKVKQFFALLAENFPGALVCFDTLSTWSLRKQRWHDSLKHTDARFYWGIEHPDDLQQLNAKIEIQHQMPIIEMIRKYRRHVPWLVAFPLLFSMAFSRQLAESFWFLVVKVDKR